MGYAGFYLIRVVFAYAIPWLQKEFGYSNTDMGVIISLGSLVHAFGKGINGALSDYINARYFMSLGLLGSAIMIMMMSFSHSFMGLAVLYILHQIFQSMGWPPCAKLLTHWFTKEELGTRWAIWSASQQVGNLLMYLLVAFTIWEFSKNWRLIFFVPAFAALMMALFLFWALRDTPESLGFEPIYKEQKEDMSPLNWTMLKEQVYFNPLILYVCFANFFLYFVRMSIVMWAPKFLLEFRQVGTLATITNPAVKDIAGIVGGVLAGYISDHFFKGERGVVSTVYMMLVTIFVFALWQMPLSHPFLQMFVMAGIGFFLSGPQILIGVSAADYSNKKVAGAATGFTGFFGYAGMSFTGIGAGFILDHFGWNAFFGVICIAGLFATICLAVARQKRLANLRA